MKASQEQGQVNSFHWGGAYWPDLDWGSLQALQALEETIVLQLDFARLAMQGQEALLRLAGEAASAQADAWHNVFTLDPPRAPMALPLEEFRRSGGACFRAYRSFLAAGLRALRSAGNFEAGMPPERAAHDGPAAASPGQAASRGAPVPKGKASAQVAAPAE